MTISTHHHLRDGDRWPSCSGSGGELGVKDLLWFPSASLPIAKSAIELMESGVVHHIEGSMNGPLGDYCSAGKMRGMAVLRSHGGRFQAIQDGEVHVDLAVIAAPTADPFGNADGPFGPSACGRWASPWPIRRTPTASSWSRTTSFRSPASLADPGQPRRPRRGGRPIGDPAKIVSGTTEITRSPTAC